MTKLSFSTHESTRIAKGMRGTWRGETLVNVNGYDWQITTSKGHRGKISTYCTIVEASAGNGFITTMTSPLTDTETGRAFWLNVHEGRATEKTIKESHYKALAEFDAKREAGELLEAEEPIKIGQIIFSDNVHSKTSERVIYEIDESGSFGTRYKTALLDGSNLRIDDHIRPFSQKFGIGTYYHKGHTFPLEDIPALLAKCKKGKAENERKIEAARNERADKLQARADEIAKYKPADARKRASLIKVHILRTWPQVQKVSVSSSQFSMGSSLRVEYHSPEKIEALETWVHDFHYGTFDAMTDCSGTRNTLEMPLIVVDGYLLEREKYARSRWIECEKVETPQKTEKTPETERKAANLEYFDYSDKAFAIIGDTKPMKDRLKSLGGRFNFRLKCGAGWIFSKKKQSEVLDALNISI